MVLPSVVLGGDWIVAAIDIGKTAFAGFGLISRKPLTILGWGIFILVVGILPVVALLAAMGPAFADLMATAKSGDPPTSEQMMPLMSGWYAVNPILWLLGLIVRVMLAGAIFRAILEPRESRWAYLRLGMGEVMLTLVVICLSILLTVGIMVWTGVTVGICFALWQASHAAAIGVGIVSCLAMLIGVFWVSLRLSLAAPMSFAEKNFRLFESWKLTRGNAVNLLLVAIILVVMIFVVEAVVIAVVMAVGLGAAGVMGGLGGEGMNEQAIEAFFRQPPSVWIATLGPWLAVAGVLASIIGAAVMAVVTAPWAEAYRQLRPTPDAVV